MSEKYQHFNGKEAIEHVAQNQARGKISACEIHGAEIPGYISAGADAAKDTAVLLLLTLPFLGLYPALYFVVFLAGFLAWRIGRAAWLGWSRLERLHRVLEQEKWEIDHNRMQERDELRDLYRAKGFDGKLLEDVLDVLMADGDRLLRVMIEEELGLSLENIEHPLKQGLGAGVGVLLAGGVLLIAMLMGASFSMLFALALLIVAGSAAVLAYFSQNKIIPAIVWNVALAIFSFGLTYYTLKMLL